MLSEGRAEGKRAAECERKHETLGKLQTRRRRGGREGESEREREREIEMRKKGEKESTMEQW